MLGGGGLTFLLKIKHSKKHSTVIPHGEYPKTVTVPAPWVFTTPLERGERHTQLTTARADNGRGFSTN